VESFRSCATIEEKKYVSLKAMLHEAIFLATCNATMTNKKVAKGCHTFVTFFATCNAYNNKQDGGRISEKIALQVAEGMLHASNLSRNVAKSRAGAGRSTFLATRNATIAVTKWGVTCEFFSCNLLVQVAGASCKLQEKLLRVTWP